MYDLNDFAGATCDFNVELLAYFMPLVFFYTL